MRAPPTHYYNLVGSPSSKERLDVTVRDEHGLDELDGLKVKSFIEIFSQYRPNANIDVEWGVDASCDLVVSWVVPETDEQYEQRLAWLKAEKEDEKKSKKKAEENERKTYERLKKKYGEG